MRSMGFNKQSLSMHSLQSTKDFGVIQHHLSVWGGIHPNLLLKMKRVTALTFKVTIKNRASKLAQTHPAAPIILLKTNIATIVL